MTASILWITDDQHHAGCFGHAERVDSFVENIDIFPTLCDLFGLEIPCQVQGESYADVLRFSYCHGSGNYGELYDLLTDPSGSPSLDVA